MSQQQWALVVDFGAQYSQLIARRVRDLGIYSEIASHETALARVQENPPNAIILSGGPASVYAEDAPELDKRLLELGIPVLGICYGMQAMTQALGGTVNHTDLAEYGPAALDLSSNGERSPLYKDLPINQTVWMSHRDAVSVEPDGFTVTASTPLTGIAAMECPERSLYAVQFHPEVHHTEQGTQLLSNFLFGVVGLSPTWTTESIAARTLAEVRELVGDEQVILGLSGGVDSSVVAALLSRALGKQLTCIFVDHGLMRKGEPEEIERIFGDTFTGDFIVVDAADRFLAALKGVTDPEKKRSIIGSLFWEVFFEEAERIAAQKGKPVRFLAQGTIYPDVIESGRATSDTSSTIKTHHNLIPFPEGVHFELIEPLRDLFKDEVRALGISLGLPEELVYRQPFPGPGLAVRIIGEITPEALCMLKEADAIIREEIDRYNAELSAETGIRDSEHAVWQYFAVLPDIRSVGVMGDERSYEHPIILRAVESKDAMTADWARLPYEVLAAISNRIVSEVAGINRVAYDITPKPPATIEWE